MRTDSNPVFYGETEPAQPVIPAGMQRLASALEGASIAEGLETLDAMREMILAAVEVEIALPKTAVILPMNQGCN